MHKTLLAAAAAILLAGCSPEPGTEAWCKKLDAKPKGDWTLDESKTYAGSCVLGNYRDR